MPESSVIYVDVDVHNDINIVCMSLREDASLSAKLNWIQEQKLCKYLEKQIKDYTLEKK